MSDLHELMLTEVAAKIRAREVSATEVAAHMLARIERLDGTLRSYATVTADVATAQAARVDAEVAAGTVKGPLHGVPFGLKDLCATKDAPTHVGSVALRDWSPGVDCTVSARLRDAGAVFVGKLQMTEGAYAVHHPSIAAAGQPVAPRLLDRRLVQRLRRRHHGPALLRLVGNRHGRLHPLPLPGLRRDRAQADLGPGEPGGRLRTLRDPRPYRADGALCGRLRRHPRRHRRRRSRRPHDRPGAGAGLPRRHRRRHQGHAHRPRRGLLLGRRGCAGDRHGHAGGRRAAGAWCRHQAGRLPRRDGRGRALERFLRCGHGHRPRALLWPSARRTTGRCWPA